jgi:hypothetical protein
MYAELGIMNEMLDKIVAGEAVDGRLAMGVQTSVPGTREVSTHRPFVVARHPWTQPSS